MSTTLELLIATPLIGAWIASFEMRLRNRVGRKEFDLFVNQSVSQGSRLESHIWDIMKAQKITPTIEVPDEIKNNERKN